MDENTKNKSIQISKVFLNNLDREYHNINHSAEVAERALSIAKEESVSVNERRLIEIASWYHDIGYIFGPEDHEDVSSRIASQVLNSLNVPDIEIKRVVNAIKTTKVPQEYSEDIVSQIIGDADLVSLGLTYDKFYKQRMKVFHEFTHEMTPKEWAENMGIKLLETQSYMTKTAKERYSEQLDRNIERHRQFIEDGSPEVLVGGTFDIIHAGHKELLETAFGYGTPTIGLTSDELANNSRERQVKPYNERYDRLRSEAEKLSEFYCREFNIVKLKTKKDISTSKEADIIVISPEPKTKKRVESINKTRVEKGLNKLEVIVSDEVYAYDGNRISSTRIRNNEICRDGSKK